jgi:hypothetical protein
VLRIVATAIVAIIGVVITVAVSHPTTTLAHEHRAVGNYEFVVGWLNEPALVYEPNTLSLEFTLFPNGVPEEESEEAEAQGQPVVGLEETLEAEIIAGGEAETRPLTLEPAFGEDGAYESVLIPTVAGDYTFRIFGEIEGQQIDESFSSGPETFSEIEPVQPLEFPEELATPAAASSTSDSDSESSSDDTATILAIIGIVAGVIGIGVGVAAVLMAQRRA